MSLYLFVPYLQVCCCIHNFILQFNGGDDCATYLKEWKENETKHFATLMNAQLWKQINDKLENKNEGVNWEFSRYFFSLPGEGEQGCIEIVNRQNGLKTGEVLSLRYDVSGQVDVILEQKNITFYEKSSNNMPNFL